ncbi:MAG: glycerol-3-phosphate 1-O-acyltransferase PlsY [Clostridiales bacterium]|jgi:glycerol-3-phosphate acyltransferase PlsY|nr:glycerol-3-phosphate 1-O-acyltransferase PlsY [Clostridiales bacterium]
MFRLICLLIGYCIGCIQNAYILGRVTKKIDIRQHGSGNAGTTNTIRVLGVASGAIVLAGDFLKAVLAVVLCSLLFGGGGTFAPVLPANILPDTFLAETGLLPGLYAGLGVIAGHDFPVILKFKGGKGFASLLGLVLALDWRVALITYAVVIILLAVTRYVSLSALVMSLVTPFLLLAFGHGIEVFGGMLALTALTWWRHKENIQRLAEGKENRLSLGKKG